MKLKITLKDPDGVYQSMDVAAQSSIECPSWLTDTELHGIIEARRKYLVNRCKPWIQYGEYVTIEIDTDAGTAVVCKV